MPHLTALLPGLTFTKQHTNTLLSISLYGLCIWETKHKIATTTHLHLCLKSNLIRVFDWGLHPNWIWTRLLNISCYLTDKGRKRSHFQSWLWKQLRNMIIEYKINAFFGQKVRFHICVPRVKHLTGRQSIFIEWGKKTQWTYVRLAPGSRLYLSNINRNGSEWWERKLKQADEDSRDTAPKIMHTIRTHYNSSSVSAERGRDTERQIQFIVTVNHFC